MSLDSNQIADILEFWRDIEILTPFEMERSYTLYDPTDNSLPSREFSWSSLSPQGAVAFEDELAQLPVGTDQSSHMRLFTVYLGVIEAQDYIDKIVGLLRRLKNRQKKEDYDLRFSETFSSGKICLATVKMNHFGKLLPETFQTSYAMNWIVDSEWSLNEHLQKKFAPQGLPQAFLDKCTEFLHSSLEVNSPTGDNKVLYRVEYTKPKGEEGLRFFRDTAASEDLQPTADFIDNINRWVCDLCQIRSYLQVSVVERFQNKPRKLTDDFFNSPYVTSLARMAEVLRAGNKPEDVLSPVLKRFFDLSFDNPVHHDILQEPNVFYELADPRQGPVGRWPDSTNVRLVCAQQLALNKMLSTNAYNPVTAVNGPPGTGKTTLLRELVADVVVRRADKLAQINDITDDSLFEHNGSDIVLRKDLSEDFAIVVASNTNLAVENITKEFPFQYSYEGRSYDYFSVLSDAALKEQGSWGFISAALGNIKNWRRIFKLLFSEKKNAPADKRGKPLLRVLNTEASKYPTFRHLIRAWEEQKQIFLELKEKVLVGKTAQYRCYQADVARALHSSGSDVSPYKAFRGMLGKLDEKAWPLNMADSKNHLETLYYDSDLEKSRTELFLSALELHKLTILIHRERFVRALDKAIRVFGSVEQDENPIPYLGTFCFFCPVISTTLAAAVRRFRDYPKASIPWVLMDEASQITPQSAVSLMYRSKRIIVVGDPKQLPPVVSLPAQVIDMLSEDRPQTKRWAPHVCSLQTLMDETQDVGAWIGQGVDAVWTGLPLRAHRRCYPPMFNISNRIAYQSQMVLDAKRQDPSNRQKFIPSFWFDVVPMFASDSNYVPDEGKTLVSVIGWIQSVLAMKSLQGESVCQKTLMVCTPFRTCSNNLKAKINKEVAETEFLKITKVGTVHKLQGRQADIVILVLGSRTGEYGVGARQWVTTPPNLINVAVSRAIETLIVIGNAADWDTMFPMDEIAYQLRLKGAGTVQSLEQVTMDL